MSKTQFSDNSSPKTSNYILAEFNKTTQKTPTEVPASMQKPQSVFLFLKEFFYFTLLLGSGNLSSSVSSSRSMARWKRGIAPSSWLGWWASLPK